ncbi:MAG TPA: iron donor protein CyaY [Bryobacteraceae bacterium]|jgi:CyaY protein|nr:iron donor protein CyaY [Bryobacteraceae bacterium]
MMDENEFRKRSDAALTALERALQKASDAHDFEVDRNQGALTIEFDDPPAKFVVSPNAPVRQIWVSARVQSFKLDWNADAEVFVLPDGRNLGRLIEDVISAQLEEPISLDI